MTMSKAMKRSKFWMCPFFKWDGAAEVSCEGGRIRFPDSKSANAYMNAHCANDDWQKCSVAAALVEYYEGSEKEHEKSTQC